MTEASDGTAVDSEGGAGKSLSLTLAKALGRSGCDVDRICDLRRLSGGASQETWAFGAHLRDGGVEQLILRRMPQGERPGDLSAGPELEAQVIALVASAGVPVPAVREVLRPSDGAGRGVVMNLIEGETLARKIIRDHAFDQARAEFADQAGQILARIHAVDATHLALRVSDTAEEIEDLWGKYLRSDMPRPVFEIAFRWLRSHIPDAGEPRLVHGDFRNGNLIFGPEGVRAVLDWELTHRGDPREDLGWLCVNSWRFGEIDKPAGGLAGREELLSAYERASGRAVDRVGVHFWEVLGTLRWGVMCASMVEWIDNGSDASIERCMIARRASETEIDLMRLLSSTGTAHAG